MSEIKSLSIKQKPQEHDTCGSLIFPAMCWTSKEVRTKEQSTQVTLRVNNTKKILLVMWPPRLLGSESRAVLTRRSGAVPGSSGTVSINPRPGWQASTAGRPRKHGHRWMQPNGGIHGSHAAASKSRAASNARRSPAAHRSHLSSRISGHEVQSDLGESFRLSNHAVDNILATNHHAASIPPLFPHPSGHLLHHVLSSDFRMTR
jgi:hypothetical protein